MPCNRYLPTQLSAAAAHRLFALPYAGGGTAMYHRWRPVLGAAIELVPLQLAGREARVAEPPSTNLRKLAAELADALGPALDRPFSLLGHSMGAWIACELARELRRRGDSQPALMIVAASPAPQLPRTVDLLHTLTDAELIAEVGRRFDGIPPAIRENQDLLALVLPALRADMQLLETYRYVDESPLACDLLALGGADDRAVPLAALNAWRFQTTGRFSARMLPGGHFFPFAASDSQRVEVSPAVRMIAAAIERYLPESRLP